MRRQSILTQEAPQDSFSEWLYRNPTTRAETLVPDAAKRSAEIRPPGKRAFLKRPSPAATAFFALALAFAIGAAIGLMATSGKKPLRFIARVYVEFIQNTPLLLQLCFLYYALAFAGLSLGVIRTGIIALGVYTGAYMGEVVRAAIEAVPKGQFEAAQAQGFNYLQRMGYIILPQSIPVMLPPMVNQVVNLFKNTSCLYIVGGADLISVTYSFVTGASTGGAYAPAYIVCGLIFFVVCFPLSTLATRWEASLKERKGKADPALRAVKRTALKEAA